MHENVKGGTRASDLPGVLVDKAHVLRMCRPVYFGLVWMILKFISLVMAKST